MEITLFPGQDERFISIRSLFARVDFPLPDAPVIRITVIIPIPISM
jgi:hypothetical protein